MVDELRESFKTVKGMVWRYGWPLGQKTIPCKWLMLFCFNTNHKGITSKGGKPADGSSGTKLTDAKFLAVAMDRQKK